MKINWKAKLSSRKFWCGVASWVTSILTAFNVSENAIAQVSVIIAGMGALAVYILAEAYADGKSAAAAGDVSDTAVDAIGFSIEHGGSDAGGND